MSDPLEKAKRYVPDYLEAFKSFADKAIGLNARYSYFSGPKGPKMYRFSLFSPTHYIRILKSSRKIVIGSLIINFDDYDVSWRSEGDNVIFHFWNKSKKINEEMTIEFEILPDGSTEELW